MSQSEGLVDFSALDDETPEDGLSLDQALTEAAGNVDGTERLQGLDVEDDGDSLAVNGADAETDSDDGEDETEDSEGTEEQLDELEGTDSIEDITMGSTSPSMDDLLAQAPTVEGPQILTLFSDDCLKCGHLCEGAKEFFDKCHHTNGNEYCPASEIKIVIAGKAQQWARAVVHAEGANKTKRVAELYKWFSNQKPKMQEKCQKALVELRST